ncbi:MAG TPA: nickel-binding protein [Actinomycetota bacterium]
MSGTGRRFLVERYVSGITEDQVVSGADRLREATDQMSREGVDIHHLGSTFVPSEGTVFSLFQGPSQESVEEANRRAAYPFHRIVEAIHVE